MRLVYKRYTDGLSEVYQTDEQGSNKQVLDGDTPDDGKSRRCDVFIEVNTIAEVAKADILEGLNMLDSALQ